MNWAWKGWWFCVWVLQSKMHADDQENYTKEKVQLYHWCHSLHKVEKLSSLYHLILVMNCKAACLRFKIPTLFLCVPLQWTRNMCKCQHYVCVLVASFPPLKMQVSRGQKKTAFGNFCLLWETVLNTWITSLEMSQLKKYKTLASCFYSLSMTSIEYIRTQLFYW